MTGPKKGRVTQAPFSNPGWIFEPKRDGYRAICFVESGRVRFISRRQNSLTEKFPSLQGIAKSIKAEVAVLDGEIVALSKDGVPCFEGLRSKSSAGYSIVYFAFDLLALEGNNLTQLTLTERKAALRKILSKRQTGRIRLTGHIVGDGERFFRELEKMKLEGMVAKRADSLYVSGRTRAWLKINGPAERKCSSGLRRGTHSICFSLSFVRASFELLLAR